MGLDRAERGATGSLFVADLVPRISISALVTVGSPVPFVRSRSCATSNRIGADIRIRARFGPGARTGVRAAALPGDLPRRRAPARMRRRIVRSAGRALRGAVARPPQSRNARPWSRVRPTYRASPRGPWRVARARFRSNALEFGEARHVEPVEKRPSVSRHGALERAFRDGLLVCPDVDRDDVRVEPEGRTGGREDVRRERTSERENELFEICSALARNPVPARVARVHGLVAGRHRALTRRVPEGRARVVGRQHQSGHRQTRGQLRCRVSEGGARRREFESSSVENKRPEVVG